MSTTKLRLFNYWIQLNAKGLIRLLNFLLLLFSTYNRYVKFAIAKRLSSCVVLV